MKRLSGAIIACLVIALVAMPAALVAQQLPPPVEKTVFPGVTTIQYFGQTLVFTSSTALRVSFHMVTTTQFELTVRTTEGTRGPIGSTGTGGEGTAQLVINWKNYNQDLYDDEPPIQPWTGVLDTEGGWTEK